MRIYLLIRPFTYLIRIKSLVFTSCCNLRSLSSSRFTSSDFYMPLIVTQTAFHLLFSAP